MSKKKKPPAILLSSNYIDDDDDKRFKLKLKENVISDSSENLKHLRENKY